MRTQTTFAAWVFRPQQKSKLPGVLIILGLGLLAWWYFHRTPEIGPEPDWSGVWYRVDGDSLIRVRGDRGEYSPDAMSVIPFKARTEGNYLWFPAKVNDRLFTMCLMRTGETARLVGTPEYEPDRVPLGNRKLSPQDNREWLKKRTQEALIPVDMGTFRRR